MSIGAAAGALAYSVARGKSAEELKPKFGVVFRFKVEIGGLSLGAWQSCAGLKVDFKPTEVKAGGDYSRVRYLPGETVYSKLVLKRAVTASDSMKLQSWLNRADWQQEGTGAGQQATITLQDSYSNQVISWKVAGVRPVAWSVTDLDAKTSGLAIETLELVHEGFSVETSASPATSQEGQLALPALSGAGGTVTFPVPPQKMKVTRTSNKQGLTVDTEGNTNLHAAKTDITTYGLSDLILFGDAVVRQVDLLTTWATSSKTGTDSTGKPKKILPALKFSWGGLQKSVFLSTLTASYTRFAYDGKPVRATVTIDLDLPVEAEPAATTGQSPSSGGGPASGGNRQGGANPTSGGLPGRAAHLLTESESLPALAGDHYGDAAQWRRIASANDIDDPLRVPPGTTVFLPARSELDKAAP